MHRRITDALMTILLFILMGYHLTGQMWHEIAGTAMIICFIIHAVFNRAWYKSLGKGKYGAVRILQTFINCTLGIDVLLLALSGITMSGYVFSFISIPVSQSLARTVHLIAAYAGYLLMSLHIGMHAAMMMRAIGKKKNEKRILNTIINLFLVLLLIFIFIYGIYAIIDRNFFGYITGSVSFAFFDYSESVFRFYFDYICIMISMGMISHFLLKLLSHGIRQTFRDFIFDIKNHKKRYIVIAVLLVIGIILFCIFGISYIKRHFIKVSVDSSEATALSPIDTKGKNGIIVCFTRVGNTNFDPDVDAVSSASLMEENGRLIGNAELLSDMVETATGFDRYDITVREKYSSSYSATVSEAGDENRSGKIRELESIPDLTSYDTVVLVYPLWWWTLPQPVKTFIENTDLSGKTIYPVVTHGGSGFGSSLDDLKEITDAKVSDNPLDVFDDDVRNSNTKVQAWLETLFY